MTIIAYVLINVDLGSEEDIIKEINALEDVTYVRGTYGAYDILVKLQSESVTTLREYITLKIRTIEKIRSTLTLMETNK